MAPKLRGFVCVVQGGDVTTYLKISQYFCIVLWHTSCIVTTEEFYDMIEGFKIMGKSNE